MRNLEHMNKACLLKLGWKLKYCDGSLWCKVMKGKYERSNDDFKNVDGKGYESNLWKNLVKDWSCIKEMSHLTIGNGEHTNVWTDAWVHSNFTMNEWRLNVEASNKNIEIY